MTCSTNSKKKFRGEAVSNNPLIMLLDSIILSLIFLLITD
jgi:hypothetical protein